MTSFTISSGLTSITKTNVVVGKLPNRVFLGLVKNKALSGNYEENGYEFLHCGLEQLDVSVNGMPVIQSPIKNSYDNGDDEDGDYTLAYRSLMETIGLLHTNVGLDISLKDYGLGGYAIYGLVVSHDSMDMSYYGKIQTGSMTISMRFKEALKETMSCIMLLESSSVLSIDKDGNLKVL